MPILKNARHELFAQNLAKGKSQTQAYIAAGYSENGAAVSGSQLLTNPKVSDRVAELKAEAVAGLKVTVNEISLQIEEVRLLALEDKDYALAMAASMGRAKLHGLIVDKKEVKDTTPAAELSPEQRRAEIARLTARLGGAGGAQ